MKSLSNSLRASELLRIKIVVHYSNGSEEKNMHVLVIFDFSSVLQLL